MGWCHTRAVPHPCDGPWAWLVCFAAAMGNFLHFGFSQSFGVFLPVLSEYFGENRQKSAWVGSIAIASTFFFGPLAVRLNQRFGIRPITICSALLCVISLVTSSFATDIIFLYISYGIFFGAGASCMLTNGFMVAVKYFSPSRQSFAMGFITSGGSIGITVLGPTMQALLDAIGWRNTLRVMAGLMSIMCLLGATYDMNVEEGIIEPQRQVVSKKWWNNFVDCSVWKNMVYAIGSVSVMLAYFGLYIPNLHIIKFAKDLNISSSKASQLFIYIGVFSAVSRILVGKVLDKRWVTPLQGVQLSAMTIGVSIIALASATNYTHFVVFSIFFGAASGAFVITQAVFFQTSVEPHKSAMGLGMGYMMLSAAVVAGAPTIGFVADQLGSYIPSFYVVGGVLLFAAVFPFSLLCLKSLKCGHTDLVTHGREHRLEEVKLDDESDLSARELTRLSDGQWSTAKLVVTAKETVL